MKNQAATSLLNLHPAKAARMCLEKQTFLTRDEANRMRHDISKSRGVKLSVYRCLNCSCFHLTQIKSE